MSIPVHGATGMETSCSILELAGPPQSIRGAFLGPNFRKPSEQLGAAQQKALAALCLPSCRPLAARKQPRRLPGAAVPLFTPFAARLRNSARCGHLHARPDRVPDLSRQQDSSPCSPRCPSLILPPRVAGPKGSGSLNQPQFPFLPPSVGFWHGPVTSAASKGWQVWGRGWGRGVRAPAWSRGVHLVPV